MSASRRVVVTGLGAVTPLGLDAQQSWRRLLCSHSGLSCIPAGSFPGVALPPWVVASISKDWQPKQSMKSWPRFMQLALCAADEAIEDARLSTLSACERENIGVCFGTGIGNLNDIIDSQKIIESKGIRKVSPFFIPRILYNIPSGLIMQQYGFRGPNHATTTACATGASAIVDAYLMIQSGMTSCMIAGGSESCITALAYAGFSQAKALAVGFEERPIEASRPFDMDRSGFVLGEGAGAIVLEDLDSAQERNAKIYAELIGVGLSADAHHITAPPEDGLGAYLAMKRALQHARLYSTEKIDYINAHATSTQLGDVAEARAIARLVSESHHPSHLIPVSSTKGATGHLLGAAGSVEALFTILSIYDNILPPTLNLHSLDPLIPSQLDPIAFYSRKPDSPVCLALSNSFGFGGTNVSLAFAKYRPPMRLHQ